jgi:hypothetical protein
MAKWFSNYGQVIQIVIQFAALCVGIRVGLQRWSHFLTQPAKVDSPMQRMIHHEDAETVFG